MTEGQTGANLNAPDDSVTEGQTGANLNAPDYRHGGIKISEMQDFRKNRFFSFIGENR